MELGYNINTGEKITNYKERMVHVGLGYYERACDITKEDLLRRQKFFASLDEELLVSKLGMMEK